MKTKNILYWALTGLFALSMIASGITNVLMAPDAVALIVDHLGYPPYLLPFIGVAKVLGAIMLLVPGFPRLKEWAYAGLFYDLLGATYSNFAKGATLVGSLPMLLFFAFLFGSYYLHHQRRAAVA